MEASAIPPPWRSDHVPHAAAVAQAVGSVLPQEAPWSVAPLGEGWDFFAFRARAAREDRELVVRIPRRAETVPWLEREILVLDRVATALGDTVDVALPHYEVRMARGDSLRHPFGAYRLLAGTPVDRSALDAGAARRLANDVGRFLTALHRVPLAVFPAALHQTPRDDSLAASLGQMRAVSDLLGSERAESCAGMLADLGTSPTGDRVCAHADLGAEHLLADPAHGKLLGVIDWGDAQPDFRGADLAGPWVSLGETFLDAALETYDTADAAAVARFARYRGVLGILNEIRWFAFRGDQASLRRFIERLDDAIASA